MIKKIKPPVWFWIVAVIALIWNMIGVVAYLQTVLMDAETLASKSVAEIALIKNTPSWATAAFAVAVWGGALASIYLLLRRGLCVSLFMFSFVGILFQMYASFFVTNSFEVYGPGGLIMPVMVVGFAILFIWISRYARNRDWII